METPAVTETFTADQAVKRTRGDIGETGRILKLDPRYPDCALIEWTKVPGKRPHKKPVYISYMDLSLVTAA